VKKLAYITVLMLSMYVKYIQFTAQSETAASRNDLNLIKELIEYKNVNKKVVDAGIKIIYENFRSFSETLIW